MQEHIFIILDNFHRLFSNPVDAIHAREAIAISVKTENGYNRTADIEIYQTILSDPDFWEALEKLDPAGEKTLEGYQIPGEINAGITSIKIDFARTNLGNFQKAYFLAQDQQNVINTLEFSLKEKFMIEGIFSYLNNVCMTSILSEKLENAMLRDDDEAKLRELQEEYSINQKAAMQAVLGCFDRAGLPLYSQKSSQETMEFDNKEEILETLSSASPLSIISATIESRLSEVRNKIEENRNSMIAAAVFLSALECAEKNHLELLNNVGNTFELMNAEQKENLFFILDFINKLDALQTNPNEKTLTDFCDLQHEAAGNRGSWGKVILGVVLTVVSIAVIGAAIGLIVGLTGGAGLLPIIGGTLAAVETVEAIIGLAAGAGAVVLASGYGFFQSAKLIKESKKSTGYIKQIDNVVEQAQKQEKSNFNKSSKFENYSHYKNEGDQALEKFEGKGNCGMIYPA